MMSSKESKDRFEKTFSRKKKDNSAAATTSTPSEKKTKTDEKHDSQIQTKSNDKHTNIMILGLQYKPPSEKKKKNKNVADGSLKPKQPKLKAEKYKEKKRKGDDEKMKPEKDKEKKKKGDDEKTKPVKDKEKKKADDEKTKPEKDEKKRKGEDENVGVIKMRKKEKSDKDEEEGLECAFPTARITRIIKSDGFDCKITGEAVFLINKATEKFIDLLAEDAYGCAVEDRKSFVAYKHLSSVVSKGKLFDFLSDFVPEKITAEKALAERNPALTLPLPLPESN